jgi:hypothetical protein
MPIGSVSNFTLGHVTMHAMPDLVSGIHDFKLVRSKEVRALAC